jgi:DNA-binding NarL/FixJ family response regulator
MVKRLLVRSTGSERPRSPRKSVRPAKAVTSRQRQVLQLIAEGLGNKEIAARLKITPSGAKKHLEALTRRYNVSGRTALVRAAIQAGDLRISKRRPV